MTVSRSSRLTAEPTATPSDSTAVEQLAGQLVPGLERSGPDRGGQLGLVLLLLDLEQRGLPAGFDHGRGDALHRAAACVGLGAAAPAAGAQRAPGLHDDMPDLAGCATCSVVRAAVQYEAAADPGAHPQPEHVASAHRGAREPLAEQTDIGIVAQGDGQAEPSGELADEIERIVPATQVGHRQHLAVVNDPGDPDPDGQRLGAQGGDQLADGRQDRFRAIDRGGALGAGLHPVLGVDQTYLDVGAAHVHAHDQQLGVRHPPMYSQPNFRTRRGRHAVRHRVRGRGFALLAHGAG